mmetsp:Transcript_97605/g.276133  ORF Transcript_97605/g.276133 Transcript_97605/m.276133 type:complete len:229 (-) Transcript_97605:27-713(-)
MSAAICRRILCPNICKSSSSCSTIALCTRLRTPPATAAETHACLALALRDHNATRQQRFTKASALCKANTEHTSSTAPAPTKATAPSAFWREPFATTRSSQHKKPRSWPFGPPPRRAKRRNSTTSCIRPAATDASWCNRKFSARGSSFNATLCSKSAHWSPRPEPVCKRIPDTTADQVRRYATSAKSSSRGVTSRPRGCGRGRSDPTPASGAARTTSRTRRRLPSVTS